MTWKRILLYAVAVNFVLFFRGCDQSGDIEFTAGAFFPYQVLEIDDDWASNGFEIGGEQGVQVLEYSWILLFLNLGLAAGLLFGIQKSCKRLGAFLGGRMFTVIATIAFVIFNSGLIPNYAWVYGVFWPTGWICQGGLSLFYSGAPGAEPNVFVDVAARLNLLVFVTVLSLLCLIFVWIKRKMRPPHSTGEVEAKSREVSGADSQRLSGSS